MREKRDHRERGKGDTNEVWGKREMCTLGKWFDEWRRERGKKMEREKRHRWEEMKKWMNENGRLKDERREITRLVDKLILSWLKSRRANYEGSEREREREEIAVIWVQWKREREEEYLVMDWIIERRGEGDPRREKREREGERGREHSVCYIIIDHLIEWERRKGSISDRVVPGGAKTIWKEIILKERKLLISHKNLCRMGERIILLGRK